MFTKIEKQFRSNISNTFNSKSFLPITTIWVIQLYRKGYNINFDSDFIHVKQNEHPDLDFDNLQNQNTSIIIKEESIKNLQTELLVTRSEKAFNFVENAASEITYCCVNWRNCRNCKDDDKTELITIKEEIEQGLINKYVKVDIKNNRVCYHQITSYS